MDEDTSRAPNDRRKRGEVRYPSGDVTGTVAGIPVRVRDLSPSGFGLRCDRPLRVDRVYTVVLQANGASVELQASVRWCRMSVGKSASGADVNYYGAGLRFEALTERQCRGLGAILASRPPASG